MGMINRVRQRLRSVHTLPGAHKLDPRLQDERTAQSVCLLSVVLLLPYLVRGHASSLLVSTAASLAYSCLVLPIIISVHYKYPISGLRPITLAIKECLQAMYFPLVSFLKRVHGPLDRAERTFLKMTSISILINQIVFFMICDRVLVPGQKVTCLYSVMFYNVIAYCVSYLKELIEKEDWSPYVNITKNSNIKHLAMTATKLVLEWTKAVTFVITLVFMLLVLGLEQGLKHFQPNVTYATFTWLYYMATERVFVECFPSLLAYFQLDIFDSLELLYAPVILRVATAVLSFVMSFPLIIWGQYRLFILTMYINVYLRCREMTESSLRLLLLERKVLSQYRHASVEELEAWDDVCAVCLSPMRRARITPCHHLFHGDCLRLCLKNSDHCPICKRELNKFD